MGAHMQREPNKMWFHITWHKILRLLASKVNKFFEKKHFNGQWSAFKKSIPQSVLSIQSMKLSREQAKIAESACAENLNAWSLQCETLLEIE